MGYYNLQLLLPTRFLVTTGLFISVLLSYFHQNVNISAGLSSTADQDTFNNAQTSFRAAFGISIVALCISYIGIFGGFTIFFHKVNVINIIMHFVGALLTSLFILDEWHYLTYWAIAGIFTFVPALIEVSMLLAIFGCKIVVY